MTAIFHDMMHHELEDYVDDIVVKSRRGKEHFHVMRKVFERCRTFKLRMNPLKCAFGVSSGKFLGFLVHSKGIDVDPAKATTIATMKPPATVKELKIFLRKDSYIWRFIPGWHQLLLLSPSYSRKSKVLNGKKRSRQPSKATVDHDEPPYSASLNLQKNHYYSTWPPTRMPLAH